MMSAKGEVEVVKELLRNDHLLRTLGGGGLKFLYLIFYVDIICERFLVQEGPDNVVAAAPVHRVHKRCDPIVECQIRICSVIEEKLHHVCVASQYGLLMIVHK